MPENKQKKEIMKKLQKNFREILTTLGYDLNDRNFRETPLRAAKVWYEELLPASPTKKLFTVFEEDGDSMIVLRRHQAWSRCPHHLERIKINIWIGYIPDKKVIGLSKLPRIADYFARGLVLQETYTKNVAEGLFNALKPKGVGVYVIAEHQCMQARGVKTCGDVSTIEMKGSFEDLKIRNEFLNQCVQAGGVK